jgi:hypothetical protein
MSQHTDRSNLRRLGNGPSRIWVGLSDGNSFSNLTGRRYEVEGDCLRIDLSHNFRVHNKLSAAYVEISALMKSPGNVTLFQIHDAEVIGGLTDVLLAGDGIAGLELVMEDGQTFKYLIPRFRAGANSLYLNLTHMRV